MLQSHTQAGNITTNLEIKIYFTLPKLSATNNVTWNFHVDYSAKGGYDMILGRYLLTELWLNLYLSDHIVEADDRLLKRSLAPMAYLGMYGFKDLNKE